VGTGALLRPRTQRLRLKLTSTGNAVLPLPPGGSVSGLVPTSLAAGLPTSYGLGIAGVGSLLGRNGELSPPGFSAEMWYLPKLRGSVIVLLNSVTVCTGGYELADSILSSAAQLAFGPGAAGAVSEPGLEGVGCPAWRAADARVLTSGEQCVTSCARCSIES
jgi:hypothetical protein